MKYTNACILFIHLYHVYVFRYDAQMEELLDQAYEQYVAKKEGSAKQRKRLKEEAQSLEVCSCHKVWNGVCLVVFKY